MSTIIGGYGAGKIDPAQLLVMLRGFEETLKNLKETLCQRLDMIERRLTNDEELPGQKVHQTIVLDLCERVQRLERLLFLADRILSSHVHPLAEGNVAHSKLTSAGAKFQSDISDEPEVEQSPGKRLEQIVEQVGDICLLQCLVYDLAKDDDSEVEHETETSATCYESVKVYTDAGVQYLDVSAAQYAALLQQGRLDQMPAWAKKLSSILSTDEEPDVSDGSSSL